MNPSCLIVIPCVSLDDYLIETVSACLTLDYPDFTIAILPDEPVSLPPELHRENVSVIVTGDMTISAKRNVAISHFTGCGYIALIDSDAWPERDWLAQGVAFLREHPECRAVGGPNITPPGEPFLRRVVGNALKSPLVSGPMYFAKTLSSDRRSNSLHSCNLILPRTTFEDIGLFDETLFTGEDRNLCNRIREGGGEIWFRRNVVVNHHCRGLWVPLFRQRLAYGYCSSSITSRRITPGNIMMHIPLIWAGLFFILVLLETSFSGTVHISSGVAALHLLAAAAEAFRTSGSIREIPHTFCAIIVCFFASAIGQLLAYLRYPLPLKRVYAQRTGTLGTT